MEGKGKGERKELKPSKAARALKGDLKSRIRKLDPELVAELTLTRPADPGRVVSDSWNEIWKDHDRFVETWAKIRHVVAEELSGPEHAEIVRFAREGTELDPIEPSDAGS